MTNADLVWRLVELLLQKEKDKNQVALDQEKIQKTSNESQQKEA